MKSILVTGGGGFVGKAIVRMAVEQGIRCKVFGRNFYPEVDRMGVECVRGDIRDQRAVMSACQDIDTVFHVASLAGIWGTWQQYHSINISGTKNVISACRGCSIPRLVYTSTPSVVFNREDIKGADERLPYAKKFLCNYARSKAEAEQTVLSANDSSLATCAIRPHLIWGPGDPHLIPRLLQRGKRGELKKVGRGTNLVDISYIDNVAHAHLLAGKDLSNAGISAGKAYFVSQDRPVNLWQWIDELFSRVGLPPVEKSVGFTAAYLAGGAMEWWYWLLRKNSEPRMTRFLAEQLAKSHYFCTDAIATDLGYRPLVSTEEGMDHLVNWVKDNEATLL